MSEMNFEQARFNMVEQQIRPWDVLDQRVLDAIAQVPREAFVPEAYRKLAFSDVRIPLGHDQVMMNPNLEGRLLQALGLRAEDKVLEIGTGSGYVTACLATLAGHVTSVELFEDFSERAGERLAAQGIHNVELVVGDAAKGWGDEQSYEAIAVTGSLPTLPEAFRRALTVGGRLFVIVGRSPVMEARLITRVGDEEWTEESLFETDFPTLLNVEAPTEFLL